ncbi:hypothetical protein QPK87_00475 [Kamptonema cortianum]|jgi:hypothetical protein|nr:hypothetical protein [Kamptonema cortianum]
MIKKFIFSLAIILSLTTHHAVGMDNEDDEFDVPKISARLKELDEQRRKEVQINCELVLKHPRHGFFPLPGQGGPLEASDDRLFKIYTQRKKLIALLEKLGTLAASAA